jgi:hypothetical protein
VPANKKNVMRHRGELLVRVDALVVLGQLSFVDIQKVSILIKVTPFPRQWTNGESNPLL